MTDLAPIALFCYNRDDHLHRVLEALATNAEFRKTRLYIFSDGPKDEKDQAKVKAVRQTLTSRKWTSRQHLYLRNKNLGLARSVIQGVSNVLNKHKTVIVLEDDLVVSANFLAYANESLRLYKKEEKVISVMGYSYPVSDSLPETYFLKGAACWGWATWRHKWRLFEPDGAKLLTRLHQRNSTHSFNLDGACDYVRMLEDQVAGRNDSWGVRWYASAFLADMLSLYPGLSHVRNIGMDGSGVHCGTTTDFDVALQNGKTKVRKTFPEECTASRQAVVRFLKAIEN